jgi:ankyrin repeat protein
MRKRTILVAAVAACVIGAAYLTQAPASAQAPATIDFQRDVQPIFRQHCYTCHGPTKQQNGFRLDRRRDALRGGTIAVIGPGNSAGSRLYLRLIGSEYGQQMPATGALDPAKVAIIKAWIDQGALWPDEASGETAPPPPDPNATRAMRALRSGDRRTFETLVTANPGVANLKGSGGSTPLMYATLYGDVAVVRQLLDGHADPNVRNDAGATALMWAVTDLDKTRLLIDHGADVNARSDDGRTPVMIAAGLPGGSAVVGLLLDRGARASVTAPGLFGESTPLLEAAYAGDAAIFRLLADHGATAGTAGPVALGLALRAQCMPCAEALLKALTPDAMTQTMVMAGPPLGPALATNLMLDHGADVNATDPQGRTMLMLAASSDALPVDAVKALIARGAAVNATSPRGETALGFASLRGDTPVVELLRSAGAKDAPAPAGPGATPAPASSVRAAVERSLPLLQQADDAFLRKSGCVSCHHNTLTALTVATARRQGWRVNETIARRQSDSIGRYLDDWRDRALQGVGIPGDADTVGYILLGLAAERYPASEATDAMARFLKRQQAPNGQWRILAHRPPIESNDIEVTAVSMRAMTVYAPAADRAAYQRAARLAGAWLAKATPVTTEERAFQLMGFGWAGMSKTAIATAGRALKAQQRPDGGWAQIPSLPSDAYATGQALVALAESGALAATDPVYKRGVQFLLKTQYADGSWFVRTRAIPIQPHFESGFPYGRDQFISAAATNWAARALALALVK